jgi:hypothetical protein
MNLAPDTAALSTLGILSSRMNKIKNALKRNKKIDFTAVKTTPHPEIGEIAKDGDDDDDDDNDGENINLDGKVFSSQLTRTLMKRLCL